MNLGPNQGNINTSFLSGNDVRKHDKTMTDDSTHDSSRTAQDEWEFDRNETGTDGESGRFGRIGAELRSRRNFMSNTAKVGAGAAALSAFGAGTAAAAHGDEPYSDSDYEDNNPNGYSALTDVQIVKFALLLERLEAKFYTEAVGDEPVAEMGTAGSADGARLGEKDVERSDIAAQFANPSRRYSTFQRFKQIRNHEQAHVTALEGVLDELGENSDFGSDLEFEFPYEGTVEFVGVAQALEDTGAGAYTAAAPAVDTEEYLASAAQILAVEARHASYLRVLNSPLPAGSGARNPFPNAFQQQLSLTEVVNRAAPFIKGVDSVSQVQELLGGYAPDTGGQEG
jgi:hypothetical protein